VTFRGVWLAELQLGGCVLVTPPAAELAGFGD